MNYYELICTTVLKGPVNYENSFTLLSNHINKVLLNHPQLKAIHINKKEKLYTFSSFYPIERNKVYQKGRVYIFRLRSIDKTFITYLMTSMKTISSETFQIISSELITKKKRLIQELVAITPIVLTTETGYTLPEINPLQFVETRLRGLLEKKYYQHFGKSITAVQLSERIEQVNNKPIKLPYKNIHLLGNKFKLEIDLTDEAQTLATMALACGLGEKTSLGFGYTLANFVKG